MKPFLKSKRPLLKSKKPSLKSKSKQSFRWCLPPIGSGDRIDYRNMSLILQFISDEGKKLSRRVNRLTLRKQRLITLAIKQSHILALLHFLYPNIKGKPFERTKPKPTPRDKTKKGPRTLKKKKQAYDQNGIKGIKIPKLNWGRVDFLFSKCEKPSIVTSEEPQKNPNRGRINITIFLVHYARSF